jgi:hypothetical protein
MNFQSIMKPVGQNNVIICLLGRQNHFDQSNASQSTQNMRTCHYAVTLHDTIDCQMNIVWNDESMYLVYAQKGNSTKVQIYWTIGIVTWQNIIFQEKT